MSLQHQTSSCEHTSQDLYVSRVDADTTLNVVIVTYSDGTTVVEVLSPALTATEVLYVKEYLDTHLLGKKRSELERTTFSEAGELQKLLELESTL